MSKYRLRMTDEDREMLGEFLGEFWYQQSSLRAEADEPIINLDFKDWRMIGRLLEHAFALGLQPSIEWYTHDAARCTLKKLGSQAAVGYGREPKEAVCAAILAWLREGV